MPDAAQVQPLPGVEVLHPMQLVPGNIAIPAPPPESILDKLSKVYNHLLPLVNFIMYPFGYMRFPKGMPVSEQIATVSQFSRGMTAFNGLLDEEKQNIVDLVKGVYTALGVNPSALAEGTPADAQVKSVVNNIIDYYPILYMIDPNLIAYINPRSAFPLAQRLNQVFARNTLLSPQQISEFSERAAKTILNDSRLHQGFNTIEIGDIAEQAARHGLLSFDSPQSFTHSLAGVLRLAAPIKEKAVIEGKQISPKEIAEAMNQITAKYPTLSDEELALETRRELALERRGGEYRMLGMRPESKEYIRRSGVSIDKLEQTHQQLKEQARNSLIGAGLGAIAMGVKEGVIRPGSPAYALYEIAQRGEPLPIVHPNQLVQAMVRSGMDPMTASLLMMTPEESSYHLTPQMINSVRMTQFQVDWAPRFEFLRRAIPGEDPQSRMLRDAAASRLVRQAGYQNIHHFMALHGPAVQSVPELRRGALNEAALATELAGHEQYPWGGVARAIAKLQDIGKGKESTLTLGDLLGPIAEIYKAPPIDIYSGLNVPEAPGKASKYQAMIEPYVSDLQKHDPIKVYGVSDLPNINQMIMR